MLEKRQRSWILKLNKYSYVNEINIHGVCTRAYDQPPGI